MALTVLQKVYVPNNSADIDDFADILETGFNWDEVSRTSQPYTFRKYSDTTHVGYTEWNVTVAANGITIQLVSYNGATVYSHSTVISYTQGMNIVYGNDFLSVAAIRYSADFPSGPAWWGTLCIGKSTNVVTGETQYASYGHYTNGTSTIPVSQYAAFVSFTELSGKSTSSASVISITRFTTAQFAVTSDAFGGFSQEILNGVKLLITSPETNPTKIGYVTYDGTMYYHQCGGILIPLDV